MVGTPSYMLLSRFKQLLQRNVTQSTHHSSILYLQFTSAASWVKSSRGLAVSTLSERVSRDSGRSCRSYSILFYHTSEAFALVRKEMTSRRELASDLLLRPSPPPFSFILSTWLIQYHTYFIHATIQEKWHHESPFLLVPVNISFKRCLYNTAK